MSDTGWKSPGTATNDTSVGSAGFDNDWNSPVGSISNVLASDNNYIEYYRNGEGYSYYVKVTNFGFSIPIEATINGVEVAVDRYTTYVDRNYDNGVKLVKGGIISGDDKSSGSSWPSSEATRIYGASNDLWGLSLSPSDINASNFGFVISVGGIPGALYAYIDHIQIKVYYTDNSTPVVGQKYALPPFRRS